MCASIGLGRNQKWWNGPGPLILKVERHIQTKADADLPFVGIFDGFGEDLDPRFDRASSDIGDLGRDLDTLTHIDWPEERHGVDRGRRDHASARVS